MVPNPSNYKAFNFPSGKTIEEKLSHSEASLNAIIENAAMTIYSLDREFRYTHFNSHLRDSLKQVYDIDIKIGDVVFDFLYKDNPQEAIEWRARYSRALNGEPLQFVKQFIVGEYRGAYKFHINPIWEGGEVTGLTCVAIDISNERLIELQHQKIARDLFYRNQALEQYSYIVAHNLRGPIANLLGIANLLEMEEVSQHDKEQAIAHILGSARRLDSVIRDLSDILQSKERINAHRESVMFSKTVQDVTDSMECQVCNSAPTILTDFSELPGTITIKAYLHSIFYNLISNSIKYSNPDVNPVIKITSKKSPDGVLLIFEDNGLGFDMELYRDQVFGLYRRFHTHIADGKGMGLFMVKAHVEALGGRISIVSHVGKGTTVTIQL